MSWGQAVDRLAEHFAREAYRLDDRTWAAFGKHARLDAIKEYRRTAKRALDVVQLRELLDALTELAGEPCPSHAEPLATCPHCSAHKLVS